MKSGFLSKKIVPSVFLSIISVAIIDSFYSAPANAGWLTGGLAVTTAGSAVAAGIAGTPVAGAAVLGVGVTAEIGVSYMCGLLGFGDPPDLINYALKLIRS
ncbi:MAG: hypothetical protein GPJ22_19100 [Microcystis aeruginosa LL13-03]|jgi:hypothetical protein|nr:hypothetical protein [Microcystis aeruginosa SX13-11]NCR19213.1 hypothetical protein [Microcystis aeruginosa LL13-03]NCR45897.1 hypothetical protein [Microcystis aeruginosa SX13-01]NCR68519.1 hypothetical protein [Microcystis aeruginosa LL11-07]NCR91799.1 hypothetical protein [Microcystis aeruginosa G13-10]NCS17411.1 hypothetical protein [Microcystis aeruginosa G13-12]NCS22542.1 hypothetical protein [Microcystis aeruginosa G11-06]NCS36363.1 hypothetical protein [Microcystis aeruginosa G11